MYKYFILSKSTLFEHSITWIEKLHIYPAQFYIYTLPSASSEATNSSLTWKRVDVFFKEYEYDRLLGVHWSFLRLRLRFCIAKKSKVRQEENEKKSLFNYIVWREIQYLNWSKTHFDSIIYLYNFNPRDTLGTILERVFYMRFSLFKDILHKFKTLKKIKMDALMSFLLLLFF